MEILCENLGWESCAKIVRIRAYTYKVRGIDAMYMYYVMAHLITLIGVHYYIQSIIIIGTHGH